MSIDQQSNDPQFARKSSGGFKNYNSRKDPNQLRPLYKFFVLRKMSFRTLDFRFRRSEQFIHSFGRFGKKLHIEIKKYTYDKIHRKKIHLFHSRFFAQ